MEARAVDRGRLLRVEDARQMVREGTGRGIRIAVIDSGIEVGHPALEGLVLEDDIALIQEGLTMLKVPGGGSDIFGHGTAVAAAIREVAPGAGLGSFRVLDVRNGAKNEIVCAAARMALELGYDILNFSIGSGIREHIWLYKDWVDRAYLEGAHVVAACNNVNFLRREWPGFLSSVIAVNMVRLDDGCLLVQNVPGSLVEFAMRGVDVVLPWKGGTTRQVTGSSFAAPRAAGLLARLLSVSGPLHPSEAKSLLRAMASPWSPEFESPNVLV